MNEIELAILRFKLRLDQLSKSDPRPRITKKGKTLYIVRRTT